VNLRTQVGAALDAGGLTGPDYFTQGGGSWPSAFAVSDLAVAAIGAACAEVAALSGRSAPVMIDRRLASLWYDLTVQPLDWDLPPVWDNLAGNYRAADDWRHWI
jgi:hypothetical protein